MRFKLIQKPFDSIHDFCNIEFDEDEVTKILDKFKSKGWFFPVLLNKNNEIILGKNWAIAASRLWESTAFVDADSWDKELLDEYDRVSKAMLTSDDWVDDKLRISFYFKAGDRV